MFRFFYSHSLKIALVFFSLGLRAQVSQPARYEREHKNSDHEFIIISMEQQGLALLRDTEKFEGNKRYWEVIFLDSALHKTWSTKIQVEQRMNILGHEYRDGKTYLIFQETEGGAGREVKIFKFNDKDSSYQQHLFKPEVNIHFTHFSILRNEAIFGGYINREPALLLYDLESEKAKIIPGVFQPNVDLVDVRVNTNETFNALMIEGRSSKNKKLVVRTFDHDGVILVDDVIEIEEGKALLDAISSSLVRDEMIVVGTWTYGNNKQAAGIFSVVVDPFKDQKINYYDFAMLNHFLDYLKPKRATKIKAKADWRRSVGKNTEFRTSISSVRLAETNDGFSLLTEGYDISSYGSRGSYPYGYGYSPYYYNPYGFYPYGFSPMPYRYYSPYYSSSTPYSSSIQNPEYRMTNASLAFFDKHGKLVADHCMKFPELKLQSKEQVSDFVIYNGLVTMICKDDKEMLVKVNESDGATVKEEKIKPELKNPNLSVRSETRDNTSIRAWYGRYFYTYGYETLKDNVERNSHDVFYINKIKVD